MKSYETIRKHFLTYPDLPEIFASESHAEIDPQAAFESIFQGIGAETCTDPELVVKFGFDGAKTNREIKFKSDNIDDKKFFLIATVPMFLKSAGDIIWKNPNPNSTHSCKPLEFYFANESDNFSHRIFLKYTKYQNVHNASPSRKFKLTILFTMMDQKAINSCCLATLNKNSYTKRCYICMKDSIGKNSFNIEGANSSENIENLEFGLSSLHFLLNSTKFLIDNLAKKNRNDIRSEILAEYKIDLFDVRHGFGTQITGNVARRMLKDKEKFAKMLGIEKTIVELFSEIIENISSKSLTNTQIFTKNCIELKKLLNRETPTIHKILTHGRDIIDFFQQKYNIGIGAFSEEPMEGLIRKFRRIRSNHARTNSRKNNNLDTLQKMWLYD